MKKFFPIIVLILLFASCNKITYYENQPIVSTQTKILSHKGAIYIYGVQENTLKATKLGLQLLDGVEVDVQISKDNTLWLKHDKELYDCNNKEYCINNLTDFEIMNLVACTDTFEMNTLEELFFYMSTLSSEKHISLDIKYPSCSGSMSNRFSAIASEIVRLVNKYELYGQVMVESSKTSFLNEIKEQSNNVDLYYMAWDEFDRGISKAIENNLAGISFQFNGRETLSEEHIKLVHKKGLKIQMWTVNNIDDINKIYALQPDFIQTDNLYFYDIISLSNSPISK